MSVYNVLAGVSSGLQRVEYASIKGGVLAPFQTTASITLSSNILPGDLIFLQFWSQKNTSIGQLFFTTPTGFTEVATRTVIVGAFYFGIRGMYKIADANDANRVIQNNGTANTDPYGLNYLSYCVFRGNRAIQAASHYSATSYLDAYYQGYNGSVTVTSSNSTDQQKIVMPVVWVWGNFNISSSGLDASILTPTTSSYYDGLLYSFYPKGTTRQNASVTQTGTGTATLSQGLIGYYLELS